MNIIDVNVKGYKIYCEDDLNELYDFFIPNKNYRMSNTEASKQVPESHTVIAIKRSTKSYQIDYKDLLEISLNV